MHFTLNSKAQVEQELSRINEQHELLNHSIAEAQEALAVSNDALDTIEPEIALKEAELEQAKERFEDAEQALREFNIKAREQEQTYNPQSASPKRAAMPQSDSVNDEHAASHLSAH